MTHRKRLFLLAAAALIAGGCAGPPRPGAPVDAGRVEDIVARVMSAEATGPLRASGAGRFDAVGESREFTFALLYDPPGWLRIDARPPFAAIPGPSGVSGVVVGDRMTVRLPAAGSWFTGDLRDALPGIEWTDPGAFVVGRPNLGFLTRLRHARLERTAGGIVVSGDLFGRSIEAAIDTASYAATRVAFADRGSFSVTLSYGGHGWNRDAGMPQTVTVDYSDGERTALLVLTYDHAAPEALVDRREHAMEPPPGAPALRWEDLGIWRKP